MEYFPKKLNMKLQSSEITMGFGSDSMLPKSPHAGYWARLFRDMRKLTQISESHPLTTEHFRSYPAMVAERQRQLIKGGTKLIHPLSLFSLGWHSLMVVINLLHMILAPFRFCFIIQTQSKSLHYLDAIIYVLDMFCIADIIIRFRTGIKEGPIPENIIMDSSRIKRNYIVRWFIVDLLSSLPLSFILFCVNCQDNRFFLISHYLATLKILRLFSVLTDLQNFLKIVTISYIWLRCVRYLVLMLMMTHWCICLIYIPAVSYFYWYDEILPEFCWFLNLYDGDLSKMTECQRYCLAMFTVFSAYFSTTFAVYRIEQTSEVIAIIIIVIITTVLIVYTYVFFLDIYITVFNSTKRYHGLMNQVEKYTRHKQFPALLKKRVLMFYEYRFQGTYFKEDSATDFLSEKLRQEITLHTCHQLVEKVEMFEDLPTTLIGSILGCLKAEVYLPNDTIVKAGDSGECLFFIASGTVAIYSYKGCEVCHLEDGAHFGEAALLMKDSKRMVTAVALEITQLYRLEQADFKKYIMSCPALYERVAALASQRMNQTVLLDERYKNEWEERNKSNNPTETH